MLENKAYHFYVITGVYPKNFGSLQLKKFNIHSCKLHSVEFRKIAKQFENADSMLSELKSETKNSWARITYVLYSTDQEAITKAFYFLIMLQPSKLTLLATFDTSVNKYELDGKQVEDRTINSLGVYGHSIFHALMTYAEDKTKSLFMLAKGESRRANQLLSVFMKTAHPDPFKKLMGIYYEAYNEEKPYVKYLLLMMFIESLVNDNDTTGVVYKISRMCAVLVGGTLDSCRDIFKKMKDSYTVRSKLVHSATDNLHNGNYLIFVQSVVCELFAVIILNNLQTSDLFSKSTEVGFGDKSMFSGSKSKYFPNFWTNEVNFILDLKKTKK